MPDLISLVPLDYAGLQAQAAEAALLARQLSGDITADEAAVVLQAFTSRVQRVRGILTASPEFLSYAEVSSIQWNNFLDTLTIDLRALYEATMNVEAINKQMEVIAQSDFTQTKAAILKAINQLRVYQFLKENPQYQDMKVVDFLRSVNETRRKPAATIDGDIRMLELPPRNRQVISMARFDNRKTLVNVNVLGGGTLGGFGGDFAPVKMLDPNQKNYWVDIMSTKSPVQFTYSTSWGTYNSNGVVAEVLVELSHAERANNLKLLPFSEYPYNIIDVSFKESASSTVWVTLPDFQVQKAVEDWVEFDFPYVTIRNLKIVIEQPNYARNVSAVPESLIRRNQLWAQMRTKEYSRDIFQVELSTKEQGKIAVEPEQLGYLTAMDRIDDALTNAQFVGERRSEYSDYTKLTEAINSIVDTMSPGAGNEVREVITGQRKEPDDEIRQLVSYEYMVGVRSLQLSNITYAPHAYYESAEFITSGTVTEVSLDTEERHPQFYEDDGQMPYRRTSIEYEIETAPDQRFPIVPVTDTDGENFIVRDEYLEVKQGVAKLRFLPEANSLALRENGKRLTATRWSLLNQTLAITGTRPGAIYTATYHVSEDSTLVDVDSILDSVRTTDPEVFEGTDSDNKITLKYYPFTIYEIVRARQYWAKAEDQARWEWLPDFEPLTRGTVTVVGTVVTLVKDDPADPGFNSVPFTSFTGTQNLQIYLQETGETLVLSPAAPISDTVCALLATYDGPLTGSSKFILGRTQTYDSRVFGLNLTAYEPIEVYVDDVKATNRTDYMSRENPVFTVANATDKKYEFIHAGKNLLFNGPVSGKKIRVYYSWLTQYLKVLATLRCNVPVATIFTPKIDTLKVRVKSTEL